MYACTIKGNRFRIESAQMMKYSIGVLPVTLFEDDKVHNLIEK